MDDSSGCGDPSSERLDRWERLRRPGGLLLGVVLMAAVLFGLGPETFAGQARGLLGASASAESVAAVSGGARSTLALTALVVTWWLSEALPLPVTALLPGLLLPVLCVVGAKDGKLFEFHSTQALAGYAHPVIFLFMGSFFLAAAFERWGLDRRVTLFILTRGRMAQSPSGVLLAFLLATAFISMWMSNTAATAMMLPLALGVIARTGLPADAPSNFARGLILAIAYGSTIGGMATPIGTPPNALVLSGLEKAGLPRIDFLSWMAVGVPIMLVLIPVTWAMLLYLFPPEVKAMAGGKAALERERGALGPLSAGERGTVGVFVTLVFLWVSLSLMPVTLGRLAPWLDEYLIGLLGGVALFVYPAGENRTVLSWRDAQAIDWGTLLLFGGGITLSDAMFRTGVAQWLADGVLGFVGAAPPTWLLVATLLLLVELLSELTSNTAIAAAMVPIGIAVAQQAHCDPILAAMGVGLAASLGFMLPISTPPNAIAYGSGRVSMRDMMRAGVLLDLLSWITVTAVLLGLAPLFVGVKP